MEIQEAIQEIVNEIKKEHIFDSHYVISLLIEKYSDTYLSFSKRFSNDDNITLTLHQHIGKEIKKLSNSIIEQLDQKSWSKNIHGKYSECACWVKR